MSKTAITVLLCSFLLWPASQSSASDAWLVSLRRGFLYQLDLTTGQTRQEFRSVRIAGLETATILDLVSAPSLYPNLIWAWVRGRNVLSVIDPYRQKVVSTISVDLPDAYYAIAMEPFSGELYSVSENAGLYRIDPFTGESTLIGFHDATLITGLGFDEEGRLLGADPFLGGIIEIDTTTAEHTLLIEAPRHNYADVATDPENGDLYTIDFPLINEIGENHTDLTVHDLSTGSSTAIGTIQTPLGLSPRAWGLAFTNVPEPSSAVGLLLGLAVLGTSSRSLRWRGHDEAA